MCILNMDMGQISRLFGLDLFLIVDLQENFLFINSIQIYVYSKRTSIFGFGRFIKGEGLHLTCGLYIKTDDAMQAPKKLKGLVKR